MEFHLPFVVALPLAGLCSAFFGFLLGLPALRLEGPYLAIATLGFGLTVTQIIGRWEIFGGRQGLQAPDLYIGSILIKGDFQALLGYRTPDLFSDSLSAQYHQDQGGTGLCGCARFRHRRGDHGRQHYFLQDPGLCCFGLLHRCGRGAVRLFPWFYRAPDFQHHAVHIISPVSLSITEAVSPAQSTSVRIPRFSRDMHGSTLFFRYF